MAVDQNADMARERFDFLVTEKRGGLEHDTLAETEAGVDTVDHESVEMYVGILGEGQEFPDRTKYCDTVHITRVETMGNEEVRSR